MTDTRNHTLPRLHIIGAGRLGQTLGRLWQQYGLVSLQGICNRSRAGGERAVQSIGAGTPYTDMHALPPADILLISTPDDMLPGITTQLATTTTFRHRVVLHCSGVLASTVLAPLRDRGSAIASVHPMQSFADPRVASLQGVWCAMEGDVAALDILKPLFERSGGHCYTIASDKKALYHAAGAMAANYLVTLCDMARTLLIKAGVPPTQAMQILIPLMQAVLNNILHTGTPAQALTGPLQRGDSTTIQAHLDAIDDPDIFALYKTLGIQTLTMIDNPALCDIVRRVLVRDVRA